jgi:hypothetical protein
MRLIHPTTLTAILITAEAATITTTEICPGARDPRAPVFFSAVRESARLFQGI